MSAQSLGIFLFKRYISIAFLLWSVLCFKEALGVYHPFDPDHPSEAPSPSVFRPFDPRNPTEIERLLLEKAMLLHPIKEQITIRAYQLKVEEVLLDLIGLTGLKSHSETTLRVDREFHERRLEILRAEQEKLTQDIASAPENYMLLFKQVYNQVYIGILEERYRAFWEGGNIGEAPPHVIPTQGAVEAEGSLFKTATAWTLGLVSGTLARKSQAVYVVTKGLPFFSIHPTDIPAVRTILEIVRTALGTIGSSIKGSRQPRTRERVDMVPESKILTKVFAEYNEGGAYNLWGTLFLRNTDEFFHRQVEKISDYKKARLLEERAKELAISEEQARRQPVLVALPISRKEAEQQRYHQGIRDFQARWGGSTVDQAFSQQKEEWDRQKVRISETLGRIEEIRQLERREQQGERSEFLEDETYDKRFRGMQEEVERVEADFTSSKSESLRAIEDFFSNFSPGEKEQKTAFRAVLEKLEIFESKILEAQTQDELRNHNILVLEGLIGEMHERVQSTYRYRKIVREFYEEKWGGSGIEQVFAQEKERLDAQIAQTTKGMTRITEIQDFARQLSASQSHSEFELVEEWSEPYQRLQSFNLQVVAVAEALRVLKDGLLDAITEFFSSSSSEKAEREVAFQIILRKLQAFDESIAQESISYELRSHQLSALERLIDETHESLQSRVESIDTVDGFEAVLEEFKQLRAFRDEAEQRIHRIEEAAQEQVKKAESTAEQQIRAVLEQKRKAESTAEQQVRVALERVKETESVAQQQVGAALERVKETEMRAEQQIQRIKDEAQEQLRRAEIVAQKQIRQTKYEADQRVRAAEDKVIKVRQKVEQATQRIRQLEEDALPRRLENVGRIQRRARSVLPSDVLAGMVSHMVQVAKEVKQSIAQEVPEDSTQQTFVEQKEISRQETLAQAVFAQDLLEKEVPTQVSSVAQKDSSSQRSESNENTPESSILRDQIDRIIPRLQIWISTAVEEIGRSFAIESQIIRSSIEKVYSRVRGMSSKEKDWSEVIIPPTKAQSVGIDSEEVLSDEEAPFEQSIHTTQGLVSDFREEAQEVATLIQEATMQLTAEIPLLFHSILTNTLLHNRPEIEIQEMVAGYMGQLKIDGDEDEITSYFKMPNAGEQATTLIRAMQTGIQTPGSVVDRHLRVANVSQEERASIMKDMEEEMEKARTTLGSLTSKARVQFLERFHPANALFREVMRPTRTRSSRAQVRTAPVNRALVVAY